MSRYKVMGERDAKGCWATSRRVGGGWLSVTCLTSYKESVEHSLVYSFQVLPTILQARLDANSPSLICRDST